MASEQDQKYIDLMVHLRDEEISDGEAAETFVGMMRDIANEEARKELASSFGLVLRRLQLMYGDVDLQVKDLEGIFGELLRDFGGTPDEPGPDA